MQKKAAFRCRKGDSPLRQIYGKVVVAKGYGVRKLGEATPVDENTLFGIGANTKAFTAAAIATLGDEGKLSWDDPVHERLKGFEMYDPYVSKETACAS